MSNNADTEADDFSLGQAETITGFRWWGAYGDANGNALPTPLPTDDFTIFILDDDGAGNPSTINQSFGIGSGATRSNTGDSTPVSGDPSAVVGGSERDIFEFAFDLGSAINLSAGDYFLVFRNNITEQDVFWTWATSNNNTPGTDAEGTPADRFVSSVDLDGQTWGGPFEDQLAFEIVPEPQHYTAIGGLFALVTVVLLRRRR